MDTSYKFMLSPFELYWLAHAFRIVRLPLPEDPLDNKSSSQMDEILKTAPSTLQARGLIRKASGAEWDIDRLPAAIVQWLGQTNSYVTVSLHQRGSSSRLMNVLLAGNQGMTILLSGDSYNIEIFPSTEILVHELLVWFGITSITTAQSTSVFTVSKPEEYVPAVWTNPIASTKTLKSTGKNYQTLQKAQEWAKMLQWIGKAAVVYAKQQVGNSKADLFLCGDNKTSWLGKGLRDDLDPINFKPADTNQIKTALLELLNNAERLPLSSAAK